MGKIDIPTDTGSKDSGPKESRHADKQATTDDGGFFSTKRTKQAMEDEDVIITDDELKLTNEAVRLIHLKKELGIKGTDTDHDKEIKNILSWAKDNGIKNRNQLYSRIKEIKYKLGITKFDGDALKRIHQYVVIDDQIKGLVNKQQAIENGR
jgi:hypothetical protein